MSSNSRAAEGEKWDKSFDALILQGGGLLTLKDAFYVHHHILEDNRPGDVYELWVQHAFDDRANLKLRMGQYEQPLGLSPEILRLTHSGYLSYEAGVGQNDFGLSSLVRGFMLSGGSIGDGLRFSLSFHAPQENEGAHGESDMPSDGGTGGAMQALHAGEDATLTRDLNTVFFRLEQQIRGKRFGLFATTGSVDIATADGTAKDHFSRYGIDFDLPLRSAHVYGTWLSGENSNPTVDGGRGSFNGGFIGAEVHIRARWKHDPRYAPFLAYLQYDRVHARSPMESTINEGPTVGLKIYPMQAWAIQLEYQHRRQNEDGVVLATHLAF